MQASYNKTVVFDVDATLADYSGGWKQHEDFPGDPLPGTRQQLERLKNNGFTLGILTTRNTDVTKRWLVAHELDDLFSWVNDNPRQPPGSNRGKPLGFCYVDDRAVRFSGNNLKNIVNELLAGGLKPWYEDGGSPLLERLARLEHEQWVDWSRDIAKKEKLSPERLKRWRAMWCDYDKLSEEVKELDREYARKVMTMMSERKSRVARLAHSLFIRCERENRRSCAVGS